MPTASVTHLTVESFLSSALAPVPGDGSTSLSDGSSTNSRSSSHHKTLSLSSGGVSTSSQSDDTSTSTSSVSEAGSVTVLPDTMVDAKTFLQLHNLSGMGYPFESFLSWLFHKWKEVILLPLETGKVYIC